MILNISVHSNGIPEGILGPLLWLLPNPKAILIGPYQKHANSKEYRIYYHVQKGVLIIKYIVVINIHSAGSPNHKGDPSTNDNSRIEVLLTKAHEINRSVVGL